MVLSILSVFNDLFFFYVCETETKEGRKLGMHVCARGCRGGGTFMSHTHTHTMHVCTLTHTHTRVCALTHTHTHTHIPPSLHSLTFISHKQWTHIWHHNHTTVTDTHTQCESHCKSVFVILPVSASEGDSKYLMSAMKLFFIPCALCYSAFLSVSV